MSEPNVLQIVQYRNDALHLSFADFSHIVFSPCGSEFVYFPPIPQDAHPAKGYEKFFYKTKYVITKFFDRIKMAVEFRNCSADHPYLCDKLFGKNTIKISEVLDTISWPQSINNENTVLSPDGNYRLNSIDGFAKLIILSHMKTFRLEYHAKISDAEDLKENGKRKYVKIERIYALCDIPDYLKDVTQKIYKFITTSLTVESRKDTSIYPLAESNHDDIISHCSLYIPKTLPSICPNKTFHSWSTNAFHPAELSSHKQIKLIFIEGVIYRFVSTDQEFILHIYPGDESIIECTDYTGMYYKHIFYTHKVEENLYHLHNLTVQKSNFNYSVPNILKRAFRFIELVKMENDTVLESCLPCWKMPEHVCNSRAHAPATIMYECNVENIGRFEAWNNGLIRIVFTDRTMLSLCIENVSTSELSKKSDACPQKSYKHSSDTNVLGIGKNLWKLLSKDGDHVTVDISDESQCNPYKKYLSAAEKWIKWIQEGSNDSFNFFKNTIYDENTQRCISQEIKKIQTFQYILDNKVLPVLSNHQSHLNEHLSEKDEINVLTDDNRKSSEDFYITYDDIQKALQLSSDAVKSYDKILKSRKEKVL